MVVCRRNSAFASSLYDCRGKRFKYTSSDSTVHTETERKAKLHAEAAHIDFAQGMPSDVIHDLVNLSKKGVRISARRLAKKGKFYVLVYGLPFPLLIFFDGTASMGDFVDGCFVSIPRIWDLLTGEGGVLFGNDVQILVGVVQDDFQKYPLQMSHFESGRLSEVMKYLRALRGGADNPEAYHYAPLASLMYTKTEWFDYYSLPMVCVLIGDCEGRAEYEERVINSIWGDENDTGMGRLFGDYKNDPLRAIFSEERLIAKFKSDLGVPKRLPNFAEVMEALKPKCHTFYFQLNKNKTEDGDMTVKQWWANYVGADHVVSMDTTDDFPGTLAATLGLLIGKMNRSNVEIKLRGFGIDHASADRIGRATNRVPAGAISQLANYARVAKILPNAKFNLEEDVWPIDDVGEVQSDVVWESQL